MKATVLKESLDKVMPVMSRVAPSRGQLPVLSNVLIKATKTGIVFEATNLEVGLSISVGGKILEEGEITVPAKNLAEFVSLTGSSDIFMETVGDKLKLIAGKTTAVFAGISATEFPVMAFSSKTGGRGEAAVTISGKKIEEISERIGYAASADEARLVLTGIKFYKGEGKVRVVATDGFRLARLDLLNLEKAEKGTWPDNLIVPAKAVMELARLVLEDEKQEVLMEVLKENNQVLFRGKNWILVSRILDGNFPDVEKIIPTEYKSRTIVDRKSLLEEVRTAAIFARENSNIVRFKISEAKCQIMAVGQQTGEEEGEIEAETEGEEVEIAFNYKYILDLLNSLESDRVVLESNGGLAPGVWKEEGNENLVVIIMPVRI